MAKKSKWREELGNIIESSQAVIMLLFPELSEKLKPEGDDVFIQEISYANEHEINIVPFYAIGCSRDYFLNDCKIPKIIKDVLDVYNSSDRLIFDSKNPGKTFDEMISFLDLKLELRIKCKGGNGEIKYWLNDGRRSTPDTITDNIDVIYTFPRHCKGKLAVEYFEPLKGRSKKKTIYLNVRKDKHFNSDSCECWLPDDYHNTEQGTLSYELWFDARRFDLKEYSVSCDTKMNHQTPNITEETSSDKRKFIHSDKKTVQLIQLRPKHYTHE